MSKSYSPEFDFEYKFDRNDEVCNEPSAKRDQTNPYGQMLVNAFSKRFSKKMRAIELEEEVESIANDSNISSKPILEVAADAEVIAPAVVVADAVAADVAVEDVAVADVAVADAEEDAVINVDFVPETEEVAVPEAEDEEDLREEVQVVKRIEHKDTGKETYLVTIFKKNKGLLAVAAIAAIASIALMAVMFLNVMIPQISAFFKEGGQVIDPTGTGSIYVVQAALLASAALLFISVIVGFVSIGGQKRHHMSVTSAIAFVILIVLAVFSAIGQKIGSMQFADEFINFKDPTKPYVYAYLVDIPCGFYFVILLSLISFVLGLFGYTKYKVVEVESNPLEEEEEPEEAQEDVAEDVNYDGVYEDVAEEIPAVVDPSEEEFYEFKD